jgi:Lsr2
MAKERIERLLDDIDGSVATQSIQFGMDGLAYQIDLNEQHAEELRGKLSPFISAARRVRDGGRGRGDSGRGGARSAPADKDRNSAIRQWALESGVELPSRGRIAGSVQAAFDASDVAALYAAVGLEMPQQPESKRSRR